MSGESLFYGGMIAIFALVLAVEIWGSDLVRLGFGEVEVLFLNFLPLFGFFVAGSMVFCGVYCR